MKAFIVFAAAILTGGSLPASEPLSSIAELDACPIEVCARTNSFTISGRIEVKLVNCSYIFADDTGRTYIRIDDGPQLEVNTRYTINGFTTAYVYDSTLQRVYSVTNAVRKGTFTPGPIPIVTAKEILSNRLDYRQVRISGLIVDTFPDDVDRAWNYLVLLADNQRVIVAVPAGPSGGPLPERLLNSEVSLTGVVLPDHCGPRVFIGPHLELAGIEALDILGPQESPFDAPDLDIHAFLHRQPNEIATSPRRKATGSVLTSWGDGNALLQLSDGIHVRVRFVAGQPAPSVGSFIQVVGQPETDLYHINLSSARWRAADGIPSGTGLPTPVTLTQNVFRHSGARRFCIDMNLHGKPAVFEGTILTQPAPNADGGERILVDCGDFQIDYDTGALRGMTLLSGTRIRASGIGIVELDNWIPGAVFPIVKGYSVISRSPADVVILENPPWWTTKRLLFVILALFITVAVLTIASYILSRVVERRGKALAKAAIVKTEADLKTMERTRLATELHDSISQTLTGVSLELDAARRTDSRFRAQLDRHLNVAANTLRSCRDELRNCLWDLRSQTIDEPDTTTAVRRALKPHIKGVELILDIDGIRRRKLSDSTMHALLQIIRELTVNAIRHGRATRVTVRGVKKDGRLVLSVEDDGRGFDPKTAPGLDDGHFGLQGIRERIKLLHGDFSLDSRPGNGCTARISIPENSDNKDIN